MKNDIVYTKRIVLAIASILFILLITSCEKDIEQTTNPAPENLIEKSSELANRLMEAAQNSTDNIGCVRLTYALSFSTYNKEFQIVTTDSIQSDQQLVDFLNTLDQSIIASLNYPVQLSITEAGNMIANSNEELLTILMQAPTDCGTDDLCSIENLQNSFGECPMYIADYNGAMTYDNHKIVMGFSDNTFTVLRNEMLEYEGTFEFSKSPEGEYIVNFQTDWNILNGSWIILNCDSFSTHDLVNDQNIIRLEGCNFEPVNPFECFMNFSDPNIVDEGFDDSEIYNLTTIYADCLELHSDKVIISYHRTRQDAEENVNAIDDPENFEFKLGTTIVYTRVSRIGDAAINQLYEIELGLNSRGCTTNVIKDFLTDCAWNAIALKREDNNITEDVNQWIMTFSTDFVITYTNFETQESVQGTYDLLETPDGTALDLGFASDKFEALADTWIVVSCAPSKIEFYPTDSEPASNALVIEKFCE